MSGATYRLSGVMTARPNGVTSYGQLVRIAVAATVSYLLAERFSGSALPIFAPITTLGVVQASPFSTLSNTVQRVLGTAVGVAAATAYVHVVPITWWSVLIALFGALLLAKALPVGLTGQLQLPTAVVFVLVIGPTPVAVDGWRVADVIFGGIVGVVAVLVLPSRPQVAPAVAAVAAFVADMSAALRSTAREVTAGREALATGRRHDFVAISRALRDPSTAARNAVDQAVESHRFNFRRADHALALDRLAEDLDWATRVVIQVRALAGAVDVLYDRPGVEPLLHAIDLGRLLEQTADLLDAAYRGAAVVVDVYDRRLVDGLAASVDSVGRHGAQDALQSLAILGRVEQLREVLAGGPSVPDELEDAAR